jgi:DNA-directed RNA polymerase subunit N (RpoN/RPB10)
VEQPSSKKQRVNLGYILERRALQDLGISNYECIFIDDYPERVKAAEEPSIHYTIDELGEKELTIR